MSRVLFNFLVMLNRPPPRISFSRKDGARKETRTSISFRPQTKSTADLLPQDEDLDFQI